MPSSGSLTAVPVTESKVESLVQHCVYLIATGKWPEGMRLPSIRNAEAAWNVNRLTVQRAYGDLERRGLVTVRPRSGWYVGDRSAIDRVSRHRENLETLYHRFAGVIRSETALSVLGTLRYLARLAEFRSAERPECAFVECTRLQAEAHARELELRFGVPVRPLTLLDIARDDGPPVGVRLLLTSLFHFPEVSPWCERSGLAVRGLAIEVSRELSLLMDHEREVLLLETEEEMARSIAADIAFHGQKPEVRVIADIERELMRLLDDPYAVAHGRSVLLSPRHWGTVHPRWRTHPSVKPVSFVITESAMSSAAEALGLPLGSFA